MVDRPVRTLLERRIRERRMTFEEFVQYAETFARDHGEPGTLSLRHVQRLVSGRPLGTPLPATVRLLERLFDEPIDALLAPPPMAAVRDRPESPVHGDADEQVGRSRQEWLRVRPFRLFEQARASGGLRVWHYGLVLEPLELGACQLTVAVVDDEVFDRVFADLVVTNDEGRVVGAHGRTDVPFTAEAIDRLDPRLSASALTLLRLAWRDRHRLLRHRACRTLES